MTFDLDAVANEETGIPFEFKFGGEKFTLPGTIDLVAAGMLSIGNFSAAFRSLLGTEQWDRLAGVDALFDQKRGLALLTEYGRHLGVPLGESVASTGS